MLHRYESHNHMHMTTHCIAPCLITPSQAPAGAPPDAWSQLLSCCEACAAPATQQQEAAPEEDEEEEDSDDD